MPLLRESMNESLVTESHQRQASVSFDEKTHLLMREKQWKSLEQNAGYGKLSGQ